MIIIIKKKTRIRSTVKLHGYGDVHAMIYFMSRSMPASSANAAHRQDCRRESYKYMIARESIISCLHASYCKIYGYEKFSVKNVKYSPSPSKTQTAGPQSAYQGEIGNIPGLYIVAVGGFAIIG